MPILKADSGRAAPERPLKMHMCNEDGMPLCGLTVLAIQVTEEKAKVTCKLCLSIILIRQHASRRVPHD
jgi:hypothetical protein